MTLYVFLTVLEKLCEIGEILSKFEIVEMTKIWKSILNLTTEYAQIIKTSNHTRSYSLNWLTLSVNFLCETIQNTIAINIVENKDRSETNIKIIAFFVKLLMKFTEMYPGKYFRGHLKFVQCLLYLHR